MDILNVALTSLGSLAALFILTKLIGYRQMSQLSLFDYINGITIGSIAAEMATSLEGDFLLPLTAMVVYALATLLISFISDKSLAMRRFLVGTPLLLYDNGMLLYDNMKKAKLDLGEFLTQCRNSGYFNLRDVKTIVLEPNGKLSILPLASKRPANPGDLCVVPKEETLFSTIIMDGSILTGNLHSCGHDEKWLARELAHSGIADLNDVFLAVYDNSGRLDIFPRSGDVPQRSMLE